MSHTQPIGIADGTKLYPGQQDDNVSDNQPSISDPEQNPEPETPEKVEDNSSSGCNGSITVTLFSMITLYCITMALNKRKDLA